MYKRQLYYRTDHHWTSLGAYYAYSQLCAALGLTPFDPAAHTALTRDGFYGTDVYKRQGWSRQHPAAVAVHWAVGVRTAP